MTNKRTKGELFGLFILAVTGLPTLTEKSEKQQSYFKTARAQTETSDPVPIGGRVCTNRSQREEKVVRPFFFCNSGMDQPSHCPWFLARSGGFLPSFFIRTSNSGRDTVAFSLDIRELSVEAGGKGWFWAVG